MEEENKSSVEFKDTAQRVRAPGKNSERGATMVEYALLVAMMSIGLITSVGLMRQAIEKTFRIASIQLGEGGAEDP